MEQGEHKDGLSANSGDAGSGGEGGGSGGDKETSGGSGPFGNQRQARDNSATRFSGSQRNDGAHEMTRTREASPEEVMGGAGSGEGPARGATHANVHDMEVYVRKTNSGSGGGENDGGSGNGSGADDCARRDDCPKGDNPKRDARGAAFKEPASRFDFHDFPRKTDQADCANAEVRAAVRAGGRTAKNLAKREAKETEKQTLASARKQTKSQAREKPSHPPNAFPTTPRETRASLNLSAMDANRTRRDTTRGTREDGTFAKDSLGSDTNKPGLEKALVRVPGVPEDAGDATKKVVSVAVDETRSADLGAVVNEAAGAMPGSTNRTTSPHRTTDTTNALIAKHQRQNPVGAAGAHRGFGNSLPRMPPPGYRGAPRPVAHDAKQANQTSLMQSKHRSIFLAGGIVSNAALLSENGNGSGAANRVAGHSTKYPSVVNGRNGVVDQLFDSGKHVEVILGARVQRDQEVCALGAGGTVNVALGDTRDATPHHTNIQTIEYFVKWIGHAHVHNTWMPEDHLDQLAPAKFGEYVLQYGRVPRLLADTRWSTPQRIVAASRGRGGGGVGIDPQMDTRRSGSEDPDNSGGGSRGALGSGAGSGGGSDGAANNSLGSLPASPALPDHDVNTKVLVKWWGLPYDSCSWENVDAHPDLPALLERYRVWTRSSFQDTLNVSVNGGVAAARAVALVKSSRAGTSTDGGSTGGSGGSMSGSEDKSTAVGDGSGGHVRHPNPSVRHLSHDSGTTGTNSPIGRRGCGSTDVSDTDGRGVTDTTDTVVGAVKAARVNVPKDSAGKRHRLGSAASTDDPAVRWLLSAWAHREGVVMVYPEPPPPPFGGVLAGVIDSIHGKTGVGGSRQTRTEHRARRRAAAIGLLAAQRSEFGARNAPALVIVPSTELQTWICEFSRYAPELDVVEYCGSAVSRHVVQEHEWSHRRSATRRDARPFRGVGAEGAFDRVPGVGAGADTHAKKGKKGSPVSDSGPTTDAGGGDGSGDGSGSGGQGGSGGMRASGGSGSGKSLTVNFQVTGGLGHEHNGTPVPQPRTGSGGTGSGGSGSGSAGNDNAGGGSIRGCSPAAAAAAGAGSGDVGSGGDRDVVDVATDTGGGGSGSGTVPGETTTAGDDSGGGRSGGAGSGDASDPASAAAAAVAAARRPKFHVLVASMDAAAQDLLLLRQVAWETMVVVEDVLERRSVTMSALPRLGTVQSANRVLMLDGLLPNTTSELLSILDFVKQSPEGMLALERHLLGLEDVNAFNETSGILEQVCLDLSILKPPRGGMGIHATPAPAPSQLGWDRRFRSQHKRDRGDLYRAAPALFGAGAGASALPVGGQRVETLNPNNPAHLQDSRAGKRQKDPRFNEPGPLADDTLRRPKAQRAGPQHSSPHIGGVTLQRQRSLTSASLRSHQVLPGVGASLNSHLWANSQGTTTTPGGRTSVGTASAGAPGTDALVAARFAAAAAAARLTQQAQTLSAGLPNQDTSHPMLHALSNAMRTDPVAATAMMQNMQRMMAPMATTHGVNEHQLDMARGGLFLLQQMMRGANAANSAANGTGNVRRPLTDTPPHAEAPTHQPQTYHPQTTRHASDTEDAREDARRTKRMKRGSPERADGGGSDSGGGGSGGSDGGSGGSGRSRAGAHTAGAGA